MHAGGPCGETNEYLDLSIAPAQIGKNINGGGYFSNYTARGNCTF